jgi:hypothetical protein
MVITGIVCTCLNAIILLPRPYVRRITEADVMAGAVGTSVVAD